MTSVAEEQRLHDRIHLA